MKHSTGSPEQQFVTVARILGSRGRKGETAAELLTDFPERLKERKELFLAGNFSPPRRVLLRSFWVDRNHPGRGVLHFEGVDSIGEAEKLRGLQVQIPREERVLLPAGSYFVTDLIGCSVFEIPAASPALVSSPCSGGQVPEFVGQVRDVYFPGESQPGTPLLAVSTARGELLVPLAADICVQVDVAARRIEVALPEGLRELSLPEAPA
jgi:16S rRNA processing protein RimM